MSRLLISLTLSILAANAQTDYSKYVNPLIGSEGPFPGLAFGQSINPAVKQLHLISSRRR